MSEELYRALLASTAALCTVPLLMLASKFELPTPQSKLSLMQLALRQGMLCMIGCIAITVIAWGKGMGGIGIAVTNFAVVCEMCKAVTMLQALAQPNEQAHPAPRLFTEKDRKRYTRAMCLFHLGVIAPAAVSLDIVRPARLVWFRVQPLEWLNLSWLLGLSIELILVNRELYRMSRRLRSTILKELEASTVNGTDGAGRLRALAFRLRIMCAVYTTVFVALKVLIWGSFLAKSLYGFFPLTTLCFSLAISVAPALNFVTYFMVQVKKPESAGFRSLLRAVPTTRVFPSSVIASGTPSRNNVVE